MQYIVDSYILEYDEEKKKYYISFKDFMNNECKLQIDKEIFNVYMKSKKAYKKIENEYDRHIEHSEIYENNINKRMLRKPKELSEIIDVQLVEKRLKDTLKELPEIQRRRLKKYYFQNKTFEQIAQEEKCTKRAIKFSVDIAIKKILKNFKI